MNADSREVNTVGEPDAGNPPVRFDGGAVVTRAWESLGFRGLPCSKRPPPPYPTSPASSTLTQPPNNAPRRPNTPACVSTGPRESDGLLLAPSRRRGLAV